MSDSWKNYPYEPVLFMEAIKKICEIVNHLEYYRVHNDDSLNCKSFFSYVLLKMNQEPLLWCLLLVCETDIIYSLFVHMKMCK